jgi:hypothetical protein
MRHRRRERCPSDPTKRGTSVGRSSRSRSRRRRRAIRISSAIQLLCIINRHAASAYEANFVVEPARAVDDVFSAHQRRSRRFWSKMTPLLRWPGSGSRARSAVHVYVLFHSPEVEIWHRSNSLYSQNHPVRSSEETRHPKHSVRHGALVATRRRWAERLHLEIPSSPSKSMPFSSIAVAPSNSTSARDRADPEPPASRQVRVGTLRIRFRRPARVELSTGQQSAAAASASPGRPLARAYAAGRHSAARLGRRTGRP